MLCLGPNRTRSSPATIAIISIFYTTNKTEMVPRPLVSRLARPARRHRMRNAIEIVHLPIRKVKPAPHHARTHNRVQPRTSSSTATRCTPR